MSKGKRNYGMETNPSETDELINVCENEPDTIVEEASSEIVIGVVSNCEKLNIRKEPSMASEVLCVVKVDTELLIDSNGATGEWLKVSCSDCIEGFCMAKYVSMKQ